MSSPALSRSPSATFGPSSSRRSHPNLQHLSLAPLTPKYPIDPSDYDAYFDPSTSELHTSASLSQISALPSPGGILTNSPARSRATSKTRLRKKIKSSVSIQEPHDQSTKQLHAPTGALSSAGFGQSTHTPSRTSSAVRLRAVASDPNWLIQTGLSLTESNRESKGQSWLSKRDSSTSLANVPSAGPIPASNAFISYTNTNENDDAANLQRFYTARSGRTTPVRSRNASHSRRTSRRDLNMTTTATGARTPIYTDTPRLSIEEQDSLPEEVEPDWADPATRAEIAAQLHQDFLEHGNSSSKYSLISGFSDPYGMLDFEGNFEDEEGYSEEDGGSGDEEEVKRAMGKWGIGLGGWLSLEGAVDAMLRLEDDVAHERDEDEERKRAVKTAEVGEISVGEIEEPPRRPKRAWDDVAWFGRLVADTLRS